jgi:hypothetical protein
MSLARFRRKRSADLHRHIHRQHDPILIFRKEGKENKTDAVNICNNVTASSLARKTRSLLLLLLRTKKYEECLFQL